MNCGLSGNVTIVIQAQISAFSFLVLQLTKQNVPSVHFFTVNHSYGGNNCINVWYDVDDVILILYVRQVNNRRFLQEQALK